ncbi:zinc ribbon domain-containing protein [Sporolactobacillus shoreicorticis]|uniref:Zinc ribbon domain-containing protein n=1 Tax=Sporolactobacillus shoreicorticis TaxID=1923877 RepID=A0ABW5SB31_9BACL|nr:zinc ribbon domain-containing protein [Sporolactobacillus shoreicorticis]MCO7126947.1 zinc ribbon domain-containing protein [Sporolactobacillus shoreicorticis]
MKQCIACGMPMRKVDDYPLGDTTKNYCKYCARANGSMQSYDEKLASMTEFIIRTQGLDAHVAQKSAAFMISKLPAWKRGSDD